MDWLEQNLDAYRIIAEILNELRAMLRPALERIHGPKWYTEGVPDPVFKRLVESKERERAIDWYESEYQQIIDYAVFPDILEILEANSQHFGPLLQLAPNPALLQARFLELEVMRSKIGRTRPISESELSFLGTFHLRFRRAMDALRVDREAGAGGRAAAPPSSEPGPAPAPARPAEATPPPHQEPAPTPTPVPVEPPRLPEPGPEVAADSVVVEVDETASEPQAPPPAKAEPAGDRAPRRPPAGPRPPSRPATGAGSLPSPVTATPTHEGTGPSTGKPNLAVALLDGDDRAVLRELYREVTSLADSIWSSDIIPGAMVWEEVCVSPWYEQRFSRLGLKSLSDFYEIISKVEQRMRSGVARDELHALLKEVNFAQVLLALRDMFQRNGL